MAIPSCRRSQAALPGRGEAAHSAESIERVFEQGCRWSYADETGGRRREVDSVWTDRRTSARKPSSSPRSRRTPCSSTTMIRKVGRDAVGSYRVTRPLVPGRPAPRGHDATACAARSMAIAARALSSFPAYRGRWGSAAAVAARRRATGAGVACDGVAVAAASTKSSTRSRCQYSRAARPSESRTAAGKSGVGDQRAGRLGSRPGTPGRRARPSRSGRPGRPGAGALCPCACRARLGAGASRQSLHAVVAEKVAAPPPQG